MHMVDGPWVAGHRAKVLAARHRAFTSHVSPKAGAKPLRVREAHPNGDPSPRQGWAFPFSSKENAMFAALAAREKIELTMRYTQYQKKSCRSWFKTTSIKK